MKENANGYDFLPYPEETPNVRQTWTELMGNFFTTLLISGQVPNCILCARSHLIAQTNPQVFPNDGKGTNFERRTEGTPNSQPVEFSV